MDTDPDEEDMEDVRLDVERERLWKIIFEDNGGGVDDHKEIIHDNKWDVYKDNKKDLIKGGYYV